MSQRRIRRHDVVHEQIRSLGGGNKKRVDRRSLSAELPMIHETVVTRAQEMLSCDWLRADHFSSSPHLRASARVRMYVPSSDRAKMEQAQAIQLLFICLSSVIPFSSSVSQGQRWKRWMQEQHQLPRSSPAGPSSSVQVNMRHFPNLTCQAPVWQICVMRHA